MIASAYTYTLRQVTDLAGKFPEAEILLAFDNDDGGHAFAAKVEQALPGRGNVRRVPSRVGKDWNDALRLRRKAAEGLHEACRLGG